MPVSPPDEGVVQAHHAELLQLLTGGALAASPTQPEAAVDPAVEPLDARPVRVQLLVRARAGRHLADVLAAVDLVLAEVREGPLADGLDVVAALQLVLDVPLVGRDVAAAAACAP